MAGVLYSAAMTDQLIRIGKPPRIPRKRHVTNWVIAAAVLISVSLMVAASIFWGPGRGDVAAPQVPQATGTIDVKGACAVLVPVLTTAADIVVGLSESPDGSRVDWDKLDATIRNLQAIQRITPVDLDRDIESQIDPLVELKQRHDGALAATGTMDFTEFRASGLRIAARCAQFAS